MSIVNTATKTAHGVQALHDAETGAEVRRFAVKPDSVWWLAFAPDGKTLATGGEGIGYLWNLATGKVVYTLDARAEVYSLG